MQTALARIGLALLVFVLAPAFAGDDENLLGNGGFEKGMDGWVLARNSGRADATVERKPRREGKRSLRLHKEGGMPFDVLRADIPVVEPGSRLEVSAEVKGEDLGNAFLKFWVYDQNDKPLLQDVDVAQLRGTFDWKRVSKSYDLPPGAAKAAVMVLMVLGGDLWLDDVRVERQAGPEPLPDEVKAWLDDHAVPIASLDFDAPSDDLEAVARAVGDRRLVLLGEPSHGDAPAFRAKARLVRHLHEAHGFDVLAFEAGTFECEQANALLAEGKVREAMFASVPGVWRVEEVRPLFEYLASRAQSERPLRLTGFDHQATGGLALELGPRLGEVLGEEAFPAAAQAVMRSAVERIWEGTSKLGSKEKRELDAAIEDAADGLAKRRADLVAAHGEEGIALLERALENLRLWVEGRKLAERKGWAAVNARDARMADNLLWLARERYPQARILGWGATMHFMHGAQGIREGGKTPYRGCTPMGELVHEAMGETTYVLGFVAHHGTKGTPFWGPFPIDPAPEGSVEDLLHRHGHPVAFVDLLATPPGPLHQALPAGPLGYSRSMRARWADVVDGLVFTDENAPTQALRP